MIFVNNLPVNMSPATLLRPATPLILDAAAAGAGVVADNRGLSGRRYRPAPRERDRPEIQQQREEAEPAGGGDGEEDGLPKGPETGY